ncbi:MAG: carboxypeptidase M32 [Gammaproteobacteria bacterium]|nr:carboxypeptidase M32 [Gammaproteobacteria bacterium]MDH5214024.1 carboxypeptidase M32 [Gammaproteobacteria bacterium]
MSAKTLDTRVRRAAAQISAASLAQLERTLGADAWANAVVYEREGVTETVRVMLRPLVVMPEQVAYLHHVCSRITDALRRLPDLYLSDPAVRALLPIASDEEEFLREIWGPDHSRLNPVYGRLDAVCDFTGARWQDSLQFIEPNLSGVGGLHFAPVAEALVARNIVPTICAHDPDLKLELPRDQRDLFLQVLLDHARAVGREGGNLCLIEPKYSGEGPTEQPSLRDFCRERHGATIVHADPRELEVGAGEVWFQDVRVDIAYRDYEARDLLELERAEGIRFEAMRLLFKQNRMVSSLGGDFDHKSCFEVFTDEGLAGKYFSSEELRLFRRHILWTRIVSPRRVTLPHGEGDLPEFIRRHREELVLKPNRGYGGAGIHIGSTIEAGKWDTLIDEALSLADDPHRSWVVQSAANLPVHEFPIVGKDGRVSDEPFYTVFGFAATDHGIGTLGRVSQRQVINVAQRGGLVAVLIGHKPPELRAPARASIPDGNAKARLAGMIADLRQLDGTIGLLNWDEETYLPERGRPERGAQLATLEGLRHRLLAADELGELIERVALDPSSDTLTKAELKRLRRHRRIALALPDELVRKFAEIRSRCLASWELALREDDFSIFAKPFANVLALVRERAQALSRSNDGYDALLDEYEPGMTRGRLEPVLDAVGKRLEPMVGRLTETTRTATPLPTAHYPETQQVSFCRKVLLDMGFDFTRGRIDLSTHPFTLMASPNDVRLTIRSDLRNPMPALFATLHEGGHALYDQGFGSELRNTLLAEGPGMGIHESQSRLWENHVGRRRGFWTHYLPDFLEHFPGVFDGWSPEELVKSINVVRPGLKRVEADEVTYNLHILLRYQLELALLSDDLKVTDLPGAWNELSQRLLGVRPDSAREGCLQDVHWALGMFGYFPTYLIGNLYAAQLIESFNRRHDLDAALERGDLQSLTGWLREQVHIHGSSLSAEEIITRATGRDLDPEPFFRALTERYG